MNKKLLEQEKKWLLKEKYNVINEKNLTAEKMFSFSADIKKLHSKEPLAYIIGNIPFFNCIIDLKYKPLIPRPETELWVYDFFKSDLKNLIDEKDNTKYKIEILDIFSGSGCIGISILKNIASNYSKTTLENIFIDFSEINQKFIKQIGKNIILNLNNKQDFAKQNPAQKPSYNIKKQYKIHQSDIFKNLPEKKWDFILANPPYIPKSKISKTSKSVLDFEDFNSLFADDNGLYFIKILITEGLKKLKKNGKLIIEFDETSKNNIENFLKEIKLKNYIFKKDQFNNWRTLKIWN